MVCNVSSCKVKISVNLMPCVLLTGPWCQDEVQGHRVSIPIATQESNKLDSVAEVSKIAAGDNVKRCSCSTQGSGAKRVWEASLSSLKSKKVKGSHVVGCQSGSNWAIVSETVRDDSCYYTCPSVATENNSLARLPPKDPSTSSYTGRIAESYASGKISEAFIRKELPSSRQCFKIMLMDIADDTKKTNLTKVHPVCQSMRFIRYWSMLIWSDNYIYRHEFSLTPELFC